MKIIILSFFLLIGLYELNGTKTEVQKNDFYQLGGTETSDVEQKILNKFDEIKKRMCHELILAEFAIPVLEPFKPESLYIPIPNFEISRLTNLDVKGLSDITIENLKVSLILLKFTGQIKLDSLNLMTDYIIKGKISKIFQVDGKGDFSLDIGANIDFDIRISMNPETNKLLIKIKNLEPKLTVKDQSFKITGIFPEDELNELVKDIVNDLGEVLFNEFWSDKKYDAIELLEMLATIPVADMTPKELLELIGSDEPIFGEDDPKPDCKD